MADMKASARALADLFDKFADAVRAYERAHFDELSAEQRNELKSRVVQFEDLHDEFAAEAIAEALGQIASRLNDLQAATAQAQAALKTLTRIEDVTRIVTAAIGAAQCAAAGDPGGTAEKIADLIASFSSGGDTATAKS